MSKPARRSRPRPHLWLITFIGLIVPRRLRADWRQEWEAELRHRERLLAEWDRLDWRHKLDLLRRSASAFWDALWLQPRRLEDEMFQDLRFGARMLLKHKGFTFIAVLTLALGIGANTTIFSAMEVVILHPFSFPNQDRLVVLYERKLDAGIKRTAVAPGSLHDWREQSQTFEQFVSSRNDFFYLTGTDQPERLLGYCVSAYFFAALGVRPLLGRTFKPDEDTAGHEQVAVLKHSLWQRRYGSDPNILGQSIELNGKAYTVVGVMPQDFNFPYGFSEFWVPFVFPAQLAQDRESHAGRVLGLLKPGVSLAQGDAEIRALSLRAQQQYPATNSGVEAFAVGLNADYTRGTRQYLPFTLSAVAFVLLIACANVANLLLARGAARQKELAVRMALGASRWRVMSEQLRVGVLVATPGYFAAIGTPLRAGRLFIAQDDANAPRVALVNEAFARRYFADGSAIGQRLVFGDGPPNEIVGIVANTINSDLNDSAEPGIYQPFAQRANRNMAVIVRGQTNQAGQENVTQVVGALRREMAALDASLPFAGFTTLNQFIRGLMSSKRVITAMLGIFALLALVMATVGLYAVMSFVVAQRTHEIGIRMALGAQTQDVFALVVKQGLRLVSLGIIFGLLGAFAVTRLLSQFLYGVTASDPLTYAMVAALLLATALVACLVPARRATQVDPLVALRHE